MKRLVAYLIMVSISLTLLGSNLSGRVLDKKSGLPLPDVRIILRGTGVTARSVEDGTFRMKDLEPGKYHLIATLVGYAEIHSDIVLTPDQKLELSLEAVSTGLSEEMTITATRALERKTPVVFTDVSEASIREEHTVEDIPMLLLGLPNVYSYSDDGSGIGYSYLKIRGFDQTRIGVMINGIPLNDPEDHQVYWVDMPDFAESLDSIQIQRGVGTSLYGVDTFGGSVNLQTTGESNEDVFETTSFAGSYGLYKLGFQGEVPLKRNFHVTFRGSYLSTDGYRENSGGEQWSAYLGLAHYGDRSVTRFITYTGNELTHAAWEASPESVLKENHRHNPITYENTIDNFSQPHYEFHHTIFLSDQMQWKNTLFAINGKGYYEQYKYGRDMYEYGLWDVPEDAPASDMIRQKWVRKSQYGVISELGIQHQGPRGSGTFTVGGYFSTYNSNHWGEVDDLPGLDLPDFTPGFVYHRYFSDKDYATLYLNELYSLNDRVTLMANLHYQRINYSLDQQEAGSFRGANLHSLKADYDFLNPRLGVNVNLSDALNAFVNVSAAHREPSDSELFDTWLSASDFGVAPLFNESEQVFQANQLVRTIWTDPQVKPEQLMDYEMGLSYQTDRLNLQANLFWMDFHDEIVPYGQVDDDGFPVRGNADKTVHRGVELAGKFQLAAHFDLDTNLSYNDNFYREFVYREYDWSSGQVAELDFSGNTIAGFPDVISHTTLRYRSNSSTVALRWQYFGEQFMDNTEDQGRRIAPFNLLNAWFHFTLPWTGRLDRIELSLKINNLLNKKTYTAGYYDAWEGENFFWPGAERNATFGARIKY